MGDLSGNENLLKDQASLTICQAERERIIREPLKITLLATASLNFNKNILIYCV